MSLACRTLGVDPGKTGAFAFFRGTQLIDIIDMPDTESGVVQALISLLPLDLAVVEKVGGMPGQGGPASFNFGHGFGIIHGTLLTLQVPVKWAPPSTWKKGIGLNKDKAACRRRASEMWPHMADRFLKVKDDGRAEAALIGRWGMGGGPT